MPSAKVQGEYSYADYLTWPEDERWEIIDGTAYLQAAPSPLHQEVLTELLTQIHQQFSGKTCRAYPAPFCVRLAEKDQEDKNIKRVVEPDITIVCDQSKVDAKGYHGVPDMIIEIISPASIKMDRFTKFNTYETVGVREYWIVEPEGKLVNVFVLQSNQKYGRPETYTEDDQIKAAVIPGLVVDLKSVFPSE